MAVLSREHQVRGVEILAPQGGHRIVAIGPGNGAIIALHLQTIEIVARDEVDHAAGCVCAVDHRAAVFQDLRSRQRDRRDHVGVLVEAPAVEDRQRATTAKTAQVQRCSADVAVAGLELVGFTNGRTDNAQRLDEVHRRLIAGLEVLFRRINFNWKRGGLRRAGDV